MRVKQIEYYPKRFPPDFLWMKACNPGSKNLEKKKKRRMKKGNKRKETAKMKKQFVSIVAFSS